jgi:hypothetical protein
MMEGGETMRSSLSPRVVSVGFAALALFASREARAASCASVPNTSTPVYIVGSSAIGPVISKLSGALATQATNPVTVFYGPVGSCAGLQTVVPGAVAIASPAGKTNYFKYFDNTGMAQTCDVATTDAILANVVVSDVYAESCNIAGFSPNGLAAYGITDHPGPVQAMTIAAPYNSAASSISAEAAYLVFGFGGKSNVVSPWIDSMHMFQRGASSGTQTMIGVAINVPANRWFGTFVSGTAGMITALTNANVALDNKAIGVLGAVDIDPLRRAAGTGTPAVKALAYRHYGQNCGYLPDSSPQSFDKRNVRDGHYAIWGPVHVLQLSTSNSAAQDVIGLIAGTQSLSTLDVIQIEAGSGLIPQCAMRVVRSTEVGLMTPNTPQTPCGCYYEYSASPTQTVSSSCKTCSSPSDCPSGYKCPQFGTPAMGWCEAP